MDHTQFCKEADNDAHTGITHRCAIFKKCNPGYRLAREGGAAAAGGAANSTLAFSPYLFCDASDGRQQLERQDASQTAQGKFKDGRGWNASEATFAECQPKVCNSRLDESLVGWDIAFKSACFDRSQCGNAAHDRPDYLDLRKLSSTTVRMGDETN